MRCLRCDTDNTQTEIYCARCGAILAPEMGELRTVTVLFADIRGFTALSERRTAEEIATRVINECFTLLAEQIEAYGGVVDKFIGDAVMALFGAPRAHENDPERAIMAALAMQGVLAQFSARVEKLIGGKLEMRVGINTGQAVAGWFGSARNRAYTVIGDAVNLASRIEHAGRPGKIWVNETTCRQTEHVFEFEAIGPLTFKGKSKPALVYEVLGPKSTRERWRGVRGLRAPLVDRRDELDRLRQTLAQAMEGHGRRVSLIGEAGIGKSRLWAEFEEQARREGQLAEALVLKGRSLPYGQLNTYGTVREILNSFLSNDHGEASPAAVLARAGDDDAPLLGQLLGQGISLGRHETLPPDELAREIHLAVIRFFRRAAQTRPLLLIFEDAHWIDPSSLALLRELLPSLSDLRTLVCCLYRPDFAGLDDMLDAPEAHVHITLSPLSESESCELIEYLLAVEDLPESLKQTIIHKAAGNPFYVEEMFKSLIEAGSLAQRDGRWAVTGDLDVVSVPDTVQGIVMTRIDGLPDSIKRTLQQAAVIGPVFRADLLAEVASAPVVEHLARLEELEFIAGSGGEYRFGNLLSQEVAYHSLLLTQRRALHCTLAAVLERNYADRLESQYATLADHYERGGLWPKALEYRKKAGARAQRLYDNSVAVAHLSRALDIIARWEEGPKPAGRRQSIPKSTL
jgi:adenylate cyclase